MTPDTHRGTYPDEIGLVNNIPNILFYRFDAACDPSGEEMTGLDEELEYECPECGAYFPAGAKRCPGCGKELDLEGDEENTVDEFLKEITDRLEEPEEAVEVEEPLEEIPPEDILEEVPPIAHKKPKLYVGLFSILGLTFIILTVAALIATIIALRWDTWINGAAEETIGDYQMNIVYLGVAGIIVCAIVSVMDILRNRKGQRG